MLATDQSHSCWVRGLPLRYPQAAYTTPPIIREPNSTLISTIFFINLIPLARMAGSGEIRLVSLLRVVVVTTSRPVSLIFSFTSWVGKLSGLLMEISRTSKPNSLALGITHRSFSEKASLQIKVSTPNLNIER